LNLRPLGYEPYDERFRHLGQSLAGAVTSADATDHGALGRLRLPCLTPFHRVRLQTGLHNRLLSCRFLVLPRPRGCYSLGAVTDV